MTTQPSPTQASPLRRLLTAFTNSLEPKPAAIIYAIGVVFWIGITVFFSMKSEDGGLAYIFSDRFGEDWQRALLWSLIPVAVASLVYCLKAKKTLLAVVANTMIFASPYALFLLALWTLDALYKQHSATVETIRIFGPLLMFFYVLGILYMRWRAPKGRDESLPFFMITTITPVLLVMGMTGFQLLTSNDYIYKNAFYVMLEKVDWQGDNVKVEGVFSLSKAGSYDFSAISNDEMEIYLEEMPKPLKIEWIGKSGPPSEVGEHKFRIEKPNARAIKERMQRMYSAENPDDMFYYGPEIYFQVNLVSEEGKRGAFIKSIPIWLEEVIIP